MECILIFGLHFKPFLSFVLILSVKRHIFPLCIFSQKTDPVEINVTKCPLFGKTWTKILRVVSGISNFLPNDEFWQKSIISAKFILQCLKSPIK
jgi:hypothetical protein